MITAKNNTILLRPTYEPLQRLSPLYMGGQTIDTKEFGAVKVDGNQGYVNTDPGNHIAWGTVLSVGPGAAWMAGKYRLDRDLAVGDTIGFDVSREVSTKHEGQEVFFLPLDAALCRFNPGQQLPEPLGIYVLTREEEGVGERFTFSEGARKFVLPRTQASGTLKVSDAPQSNVKFTIERVVAVGKGGMGHSEIRTERSVHVEQRLDGKVLSSKVVEKQQTPVWIQPEPEAVGTLALFLFTMSVDVTVQGVRHRFTNWDRVRAAFYEEVA